MNIHATQAKEVMMLFPRILSGQRVYPCMKAGCTRLAVCAFGLRIFAHAAARKYYGIDYPMAEMVSTCVTCQEHYDSAVLAELFPIEQPAVKEMYDRAQVVCTNGLVPDPASSELFRVELMDERFIALRV